MSIKAFEINGVLHHVDYTSLDNLPEEKEIDDTPIAGSTNLITSGAVAEALASFTPGSGSGSSDIYVTDSANEGSSDPISSGGVYTIEQTLYNEIWTLDENVNNRIDQLANAPAPTVDYNSLTNKPDIAGIDASISRIDTELQSLNRATTQNSIVIGALTDESNDHSTQISALKSSVLLLGQDIQNMDYAQLKNKPDIPDIGPLTERVEDLESIAQARNYDALLNAIQILSLRVDALENGTDAASVQASASGTKLSMSGSQADVSGSKLTVNAVNASVSGNKLIIQQEDENNGT